MSFAAVGCGDDEDTTGGDDAGKAGTGGKGGSGGKGGTGGKGGAGGKGGSGGAPDTAACVTQTTAIFKGQPKGLSAECISCACKEGADAITACNSDAAKCWGLIACADEKCPDPATVNACAPVMCMEFISGGLAAQKAGMVLDNAACKAKCAADTADAGAPDAGN